MHDIDRTLMEYNPEAESFEEEQFEFTEGEQPGDAGEVFGEAELMELATEMLEVTNEEELNYFLGNLIRKAGSALKKVVSSPVGRALGGILKGAARKALPVVGGALGDYVGGPAGAKIGSQLASGAGRIFGLETEGLSYEDEQFEVAKQFVRFAGDAVKRAAVASGGEPGVVARAAVTQAAQRHAPGLLRGAGAPPPAAGVKAVQAVGRGRTGRWARRGNRIILYGV
jgi:uncharacterized protein (DUF697 family)